MMSIELIRKANNDINDKSKAISVIKYNISQKNMLVFNLHVDFHDYFIINHSQFLSKIIDFQNFVFRLTYISKYYKFLKTMFETNGQESSLHSKQESIPDIFSLKDQMISLTHRLASIQNSLNNKVDRTQCMLLMEKKANCSYMKKIMQDLRNQLVEQRNKQQQFIEKIETKHNEVINSLMQKINTVQDKKKQLEKKLINGQIANKSQKTNKKLIKSHEMCLQSSQTMFSLLIQQMEKMKHGQKNVEKTLQHKHKNTINLNNEVCVKLQRMEGQIEQIYKHMESKTYKNSNISPQNASNQVTHSKYHQIVETPLYKSKKKQVLGESYENVRAEIQASRIENIEKNLVNKVNIKDVMPIIKTHIEPLSQEINGLRNYMEQSLQSMRKILTHQSEINQQLCSTLRIGWWQGFRSDETGNVLWQKQLINMYPEGFSYRQQEAQITVEHQGSYLINIYQQFSKFNEKKQEYQLIVNSQNISIFQPTILRLEKSSKISVLGNDTMYISIQKL